jgi:hypothetical protein
MTNVFYKGNYYNAGSRFILTYTTAANSSYEVFRHCKYFCVNQAIWSYAESAYQWLLLTPIPVHIIYTCHIFSATNIMFKVN